MICPKHKDCLTTNCIGKVQHEKERSCIGALNSECPNCIPVKEDNKDEEEIICKPIDPNRSY